MPWFKIRYECPRCAAAWADEWDAVVDDDCPACGLRHVVAMSAEAADAVDAPVVVARAPAAAPAAASPPFPRDAT